MMVREIIKRNHEFVAISGKLTGRKILHLRYARGEIILDQYEELILMIQ